MSEAARSWWGLGGRRQMRPAASRPPRPAGGLVWLHCAGAASQSGMGELAQRLLDEQRASVVMTSALPLTVQKGVVQDAMPDESLSEIRAFLDHWRPDAAVFSEGEIRPTLLSEMAERKLPVLMADASDPHFPRGRESWIPGAMRRALQPVSRIFAIDEAAAKAFRKAGASPARVFAAGRLEERSHALPCIEAERDYLARLLVARPVWFAAAVPPAEEAAVLAAHRKALQISHRLLLILMPAEPGRAESLARELEESGFTMASRQDDQDPESDTEIFVVNDPAELGMWYRLAPVTYLGGGLSGAGLLLMPFAPAALGSAILHGPRAGDFAAPLARLGAARAARAVASARDLGEALADLSAPDRSARMAQAAWGVVSEGAEVTEEVLDMLEQFLGAVAVPAKGKR